LSSKTYNAEFTTYINNTDLLYQYADFFYYTLPHPRYADYLSTNFDVTRNKVNS